MHTTLTSRLKREQISLTTKQSRNAEIGDLGSNGARRLLDLLGSFEGSLAPLSVDQLVERCYIPRSSVYRILALLRDAEFIETADTAKYRLGPKMVTLGYAARAAYDLSEHWQPLLSSLVGEVNETALILRRVGKYAVCIDRVESDHPIRLSFEIGRTLPLHHGAGAKTLLAFSTSDFQSRYLDEEVPAKERPQLEEELAHIAEKGLGESVGEVDPGIWAIASPIVSGSSRTPLVLSVAVPDYRITEENKAKIISATTTVASTLRRTLRVFT
jgi:DNA-binding IclR family transcriptional regulator